MANMFSGYSKKKIPSTLKECAESSPMSSNLWGWAERVEVWGRVLFWILVIAGLVLTIKNNIVEEDYYYRTFTLEWTGASLELLSWGLYAFIEYCVYRVLALSIGALASIVQNTKVSADVALFCAIKDTIQTTAEKANDVKTNAQNRQEETVAR